MKFYVASSWRNEHQPAAVKLLRNQGHEVYDFRCPKPGDNGFQWAEIDESWLEWDVDSYRRALKDPAAENGFSNDLAGMRWADTCIVVMPCGRSAHLEAGWFCGQGKPCVWWFPEGEMVEPELMVKLGSGILSGIQELSQFAGYKSLIRRR